MAGAAFVIAVPGADDVMLGYQSLSFHDALYVRQVLGLPMGVDVCYTNHAEADQDDMDTLLTLLGVAGAAFVIAVPGADDVMLGYQSLSFHDALYVRQVLGLRAAPEFETWLHGLGMADEAGRIRPVDADASPLLALTTR
ncbi:ethanolamine ammonia-lyase large subunit, EutB [Mycobacteroides abscessus subsp. abscessus]|nr:ethanolamine ammonia-lyase large subunit, EutB [Mycobacteroides abscessus subsp. abscessus]